MNTKCGHLIRCFPLVAGCWCVGSLSAGDPPPATVAVTNQVEAIKPLLEPTAVPPTTSPSISAVLSAPVQLPEPSASEATASAPFSPIEAPPSLATSFGLSLPETPGLDGDAETQRRLELPTPMEQIERHGALGFVFREPEPQNFVDLISPLAPEDFGPSQREIFNRDPTLKPGATLPRSFYRDLINHEPVLSLFNWSW